MREAFIVHQSTVMCLPKHLAFHCHYPKSHIEYQAFDEQQVTSRLTRNRYLYSGIRRRLNT